MSAEAVLKATSFGERIAEDEGDALESYFVETENWRRLYDGSVDVVYGAKGSGKSALYSLLMRRSTDLFDRDIIEVAAENPQGAPAFKSLQLDPPRSREEYEGLWKLYILSLLSGVFDDYGFKGSNAASLRAILEKEGLVKAKPTLSWILQRVAGFVKNAFRPQELSADVSADPATGTLMVSPKIVFREPPKDEADRGAQSIDDLLQMASAALEENGGFTVWILLDRLDVAFAENDEVEQQALRALFHTYLDLMSMKNIKLKIFLRTDIWKKITEGGFREASHVTKSLVITWDRSSFLNLILKRAASNKRLLEYYGLGHDEIFSSMDSQENIFFRIFPKQIDIGPNKPNTLDWLLSRTRDGLANAPRELIHMLNELKARQLKRFEIKAGSPDGENLFERVTFKLALPEVSRTRLVQTLYAENPAATERIESLRQEKTAQSTSSLAGIWGTSEVDARTIADDLAQIGFFERRGTKDNPEYWVPFLYRDALELIQGAAD